MSGDGNVPEHHLLRLIDEFSLLGEAIRFTGGEPLCHPSWRSLLRRSREKGFSRIHVQTNAALLRDDDVAALCDADFPGLGIQVSLDGACAATNDRVRGEGAFAATVSGLERLIEAGLGNRITLFLVEMRHNLLEIPDLLRLADEWGIPSVVTGTLVSHGRAAAGEAMPGVADYEALLKRHEEDAVFRERYERLGTVALLEWRRQVVPRSDCCTFVENPYLAPNGMLFPCVLFHAAPYAVRDVFSKSLRDAFAEGAPVWSELRRVSSMRPESVKDCRECVARTFCGGGCMGRAWARSGETATPEDRCDLRRVIYEKYRNLPVDPPDVCSPSDPHRGKIPHCG